MIRFYFHELVTVLNITKRPFNENNSDVKNSSHN